MTKSNCLVLLMGTLTLFPVGAITVQDAPKNVAVKLAVSDLNRILGDKDFVVSCRTNATLATQEWRLKSDGKVLTVEGRDEQGLAYGLYSFLEQIVGCRWYAPDTEVIPALAHWTLPVFTRSGRPAILSRESSVGRDFVDGLWRLRNKENTRSSGGDSESCGQPRRCHSFRNYAEALGRNDAKAGKDWFCLTDPEIRQAVAELMKGYIRDDRTKARKRGVPAYQWPTIYELSQNDGGTDFKCLCADCLRLKEAAGSWSGPNIDFTSAVAKEVAKEFPDVWVRTFAYSYTEQPPVNDLRAADNVIVRYCRSFMFQPLTDETDNGVVFRRWNGHVDRKFVWSYWKSYSGPLFPALKPRDEIQREMRFCRDMHVHGYYGEAEAPLSRSFGMMNHWIIRKTLENPDLDVRSLAREFIHAYYGAAEGAMTAYLDYLEQREKETYSKIDPAFLRQTSSGHLAMYTQRGYLDAAFFAKVEPILAEAERRVMNDPHSLAHVRAERLVFDRTVVDSFRVAASAGLDVVAAARRIPVETQAIVAPWWFEKKERAVRKEQARRESERALAFAARYPIATPPELAGRDYEEWSMARLRETFTQVADDDSAIGCACYDATQKPTDRLTLLLRASLEKISATCELARATIPQDEKYHLVRIGRQRVTCENYITLGASKGRIWLPAFSPEHDEREFWVSVKFTGPAYVTGSTKSDRILFDRLFIVR